MKNKNSKDVLIVDGNKNNLWAFAVIILSLFLPSVVFGAVTAPGGGSISDALPAIVSQLAAVVENMMVQILVGVVILVMLISSAWQMYENGNARPLKWAIGASLVMAGAVFFGDALASYSGSVFSGFNTGTASFL